MQRAAGRHSAAHTATRETSGNTRLSQQHSPIHRLSYLTQHLKERCAYSSAFGVIASVAHHSAPTPGSTPFSAVVSPRPQQAMLLTTQCSCPAPHTPQFTMGRQPLSGTCNPTDSDSGAARITVPACIVKAVWSKTMPHQVRPHDSCTMPNQNRLDECSASHPGCTGPGMPPPCGPSSGKGLSHLRSRTARVYGEKNKPIVHQYHSYGQSALGKALW